MPPDSPARRRELGRGERVLPGIWRLRLPLPWPGVPHCNAWAIAQGDGIVLVDTGMHEPGSLAHLELALAQVNLALQHVRLVVCTHAHSDHCGQAGPIIERARPGCELWMHPNRAHMTGHLEDPEAALARRIEVARSSGVPEAPLRAWAESRRSQSIGLAPLPPVERDLVAGATVDTDLGAWRVIETPGHAPSHVCLYQPEHRLLISGDHLLGRVSLYFDYGYTPDPVGEFLTSLDAVERLDCRLALSGHGRTFTDIGAHIDANRELIAERLDAVLEALRSGGEATAFDLTRRMYGDAFGARTANWLLTTTLSYLDHLAARGEVRRIDGEPQRWAAGQP